MPDARRLTLDEIARTFADPQLAAQFPPILSPQQFATLFGISLSTTYSWISSGRLNGAVTKVGKHRRIWRDRVVHILFNRGQPHTSQKEEKEECREL